MSYKQLIKGQTPSMSNLYYWYTSKVVVMSTLNGDAFSIQNKGFMKQTSMAIFGAHLEIRLSYSMSAGYCECSIDLKCEDGTTLETKLFLQECGNNVRSETFTIDIPDTTKVVSSSINIKYSGIASVNLYSVEALYDDSGTILEYTNDFSEKSILYGLYCDIPILGGDSDD